MSFELIKKLKFLSIFTLLTICFFLGSIGLYKQLDTNIESLRIKAESLEKENRKIANEKKETDKKVKDSEQFLEANKNLRFFNLDDELAYFSQRDSFIAVLNKFHPSVEVKFDMKSNNTSTYLNYYNVVIDFKYRNIYHLYKLINFIEYNWFHEFEKLRYDTNTKKFSIFLKVYSNKDGDKDGVNFGDNGNSFQQNTKRGKL